MHCMHTAMYMHTLFEHVTPLHYVDGFFSFLTYSKKINGKNDGHLLLFLCGCQQLNYSAEWTAFLHSYFMIGIVHILRDNNLKTHWKILQND